jgi:hypothetical protein
LRAALAQHDASGIKPTMMFVLPEDLRTVLRQFDYAQRERREVADALSLFSKIAKANDHE